MTVTSGCDAMVSDKSATPLQCGITEVGSSWSSRQLRCASGWKDEVRDGVRGEVRGEVKDEVSGRLWTRGFYLDDGNLGLETEQGKDKEDEVKLAICQDFVDPCPELMQVPSSSVSPSHHLHL